jgi:hypothetical protein
MAAAVGEMCGVTHDHPAKLFEDAVRKFHEGVIYHFAGRATLGATSGRMGPSPVFPSPVFRQRVAGKGAHPLDTTHPLQSPPKPENLLSPLFRLYLDLTPLESEINPKIPRNILIPKDRVQGCFNTNQ